jgi:hypothetical protein
MSTEDDVAAFATALKIAEEDLYKLPTTFLERQMIEHMVPPPAQAHILRQAGLQTTEGQLHAYLTQRDERQICPWMAEEKRALLHLQRMEEAVRTPSAGQDLQDDFVRSARAGILTPTEVLVGQYLIFGDGVLGPRQLMHMLLRIPADHRVKVHNWMLAQAMPRAMKDSYGEVIARLELPLFPPLAPDLQALNTKLLTANKALEGGSISGKKGAHLFSVPHNDVELLGGGSLPLFTKDGATHLETGPLEDALGALSNQLQQQQQTIMQLQQQIRQTGQDTRNPNRSGYRGPSDRRNQPTHGGPGRSNGRSNSQPSNRGQVWGGSDETPAPKNDA